jgi:hypothetical protein
MNSIFNRFRNSLRTVVALTLTLIAFGSVAFAQTAVTQTTLSAAVVYNDRFVSVTSATGISAGGGIFVDSEFMQVNTVVGTRLGVQRGMGGSATAAHASGATVYAGGPISNVPSGSAPTGSGPFWLSDPPLGSCTYVNEGYTLRINTKTGRIWTCQAGTWLNAVDSFVFLGPGPCNSSVSGNSSGTNGFTTVGAAPGIPVVQASTSSTGTNTHYFQCHIPIPSRLAGSKGAWLVDVEFYYGVQTTGLGTQVATLASGTMNSKTVFQSVTYPASGAAETATGYAELARADAGTLLITPVVGSSNVAITTAGEFYAARFTPSVPFALTTDRADYVFTASLLNTATSATVVNSPGILVHYRTLVDGR